MPDTGESLVIVEGSHDQVNLAPRVAIAVGAFANSHAVEIMSFNELTTVAHNSPNMDKIDHMLLNEKPPKLSPWWRRLSETRDKLSGHDGLVDSGSAGEA